MIKGLVDASSAGMNETDASAAGGRARYWRKISVFVKGDIYFLKNLRRGDTGEGVLGISVVTHSQTPSISEGEAALHTAQRTTVLTVPEKLVKAPVRL